MSMTKNNEIFAREPMTMAYMDKDEQTVRNFET